MNCRAMFDIYRQRLLMERYQLSPICFLITLLPIFYILIAYPCATFLSSVLSQFMSAFFPSPPLSPSPSFSLFSLSFFHFLFQASSKSLFVFLSYAMFDFVWLSFFGRPYVLFLSILQTATLLVSIFDIDIFLGFWGIQFS